MKTRAAGKADDADVFARREHPTPRVGVREGNLAFSSVLVLVEEIYAAAENPSKWREVLRHVADAMRCRAAGLWARDVGRSTEWTAVVVDCALSPDPFLGSNLKSGQIELLQNVTPFQRAANICISRDDQLLAHLVLLGDRDPFVEGDLQVVGAIVPHFRRALRMQQLSSTADAARRTLVDVIDRLAVGVVLLDSAGAVVYSNTTANNLFSSADGIRMVRGRIELQSTAETSALHRLAGDAASGGHDARPRGGGAMRVRRASARPLHLLVTPAPPSGGLVLAHTPAVAVFISDPSSSDQIEPAVLQRLFDLTDAESMVASHLAAGHTIIEIAQSLRVTGSTVRSHLKSIFDKTETHRQSELVKQIVGGVANQIQP